TLLAGLELCDVITQLPGSLNAMIREDQSGLSLGQRQRLLLARAMYSKRPILLLDEPTANLDEATSQQVIASVVQHCRAHSKTLVVVTHNENVLSMFDSVMRLESGRLLSVELAKHQNGRLSA
ncbi:ATP-binding cassette domain-containing protein, partial [Rahnella variigena]|uniref:ATP-binding cassette domain-containing protein n=1 Tax=Rahnella variigena TaxID=574964 RepID=UPI002448439E